MNKIVNTQLPLGVRDLDGWASRVNTDHETDQIEEIKSDEGKGTGIAYIVIKNICHHPANSIIPVLYNFNLHYANP